MAFAVRKKCFSLWSQEADKTSVPLFREHQSRTCSEEMSLTFSLINELLWRSANPESRLILQNGAVCFLKSADTKLVISLM